MKSLKDLLLNHKIPGVKLSETRHICAQTASALLKVPISPKMVDYHDSILLFNVSPVIKSELYMRQNELIALLEAQGVTVSSLR